MSTRTGFLARSFLPFSTLTVSFGYGSDSDELIEPEASPQPELVPGATGPSQRADTFKAPVFTTAKKRG